AERLRAVDRVLVERERGGEPHAAVVPGRLRIVLQRAEVEPLRAETTTAASLSPGERLISSASGPRSEYAMSTSPRFSIASRVRSSGTTFHTRRFTLGCFRQ